MGLCGRPFCFAPQFGVEGGGKWGGAVRDEGAAGGQGSTRNPQGGRLIGEGDKLSDGGHTCFANKEAALSFLLFTCLFLAYLERSRKFGTFTLVPRSATYAASLILLAKLFLIDEKRCALFQSNNYF